jgi:hypothetical protein
MPDYTDRFKPDVRNIPTPEEVNFYHLASDKDSGPGALHHTLGLGPSQASPGNHNHDGRNSKRVELKNLDGAKITYQPEGGTNGTQPTFNGTPLITGSYTKWGNMCHYSIHVDFANILTFGTGRYYLTLPFKVDESYKFRDGCLHTVYPGGTTFHISGHVDADSNRLELYSSDKVASGVQDVDFTASFPVVLTTAGRFHIAGTYEIKQ